jgi:hypothetical protein
MAESHTAAANKLVRFGGRAQKEFNRAYERGLISNSALKKSKKKFAKRAGHNQPKPEFAETDISSEKSSVMESAMETVAQPVAAAAGKVSRYLNRARKAPSGKATMGVRG